MSRYALCHTNHAIYFAAPLLVARSVCEDVLDAQRTSPPCLVYAGPSDNCPPDPTHPSSLRGRDILLFSHLAYSLESPEASAPY